MTALELEHYPGMTERAIEAMIDEAQRRFGLNGARVVHRVGRLRPCDQIVLVAVTAPHRAAALGQLQPPSVHGMKLRQKAPLALVHRARTAIFFAAPGLP